MQPFRLVAWLATGLALYAFAYALAPIVALPGNAGLAAVQTAAWKAGHVTVFAWIGYRLAVTALGRVDRIGDDIGLNESDPHYGQRLVARAIVIGAAVLAGAIGL